MKNLLLAILIIISTDSVFAHNRTSNIIGYGNILCNEITYTKGANEMCQNWVLNNSQLTELKQLYTFTMNICNTGPMGKSLACYTKAAQLLNNETINLATRACNTGPIGYQLQCLQPYWEAQTK